MDNSKTNEKNIDYKIDLIKKKKKLINKEDDFNNRQQRVIGEVMDSLINDFSGSKASKKLEVINNDMRNDFKSIKTTLSCINDELDSELKQLQKEKYENERKEED